MHLDKRRSSSIMLFFPASLYNALHKIIIAMDTGIKVGDCMKSRLVTIGENASVFEAAKKMADNKIGSLLVESKGTITGIVTDYDLVKNCLAKRKTDLKIRDVSSKTLLGVSPEADLTEAAKIMGSKSVRRLAVFKNGKVVGIISSSDIIRISPSLYDLIAQKNALDRQARN